MAEEERTELHVVQECRSVKSDAVWVHWLGYPKSRNCWRSVRQHFPELEGEEASAVLAAHNRVKFAVTPMAEEELPGDLLVLDGRQPKARELREQPLAKAAPSGPSGPAVKKQKRQQFETKVHTIRIGESSIEEIRGVRRSGSLVEETLSHRLIDEGAWRLPKACMFRLSVSEVKDDAVRARRCLPRPAHCARARRLLGDASGGAHLRARAESSCPTQVTLKWVFPESSPGDASAWVGLWDASSTCRPHARALARHTTAQSRYVRACARARAAAGWPISPPPRSPRRLGSCMQALTTAPPRSPRRLRLADGRGTAALRALQVAHEHAAGGDLPLRPQRLGRVGRRRVPLLDRHGLDRVGRGRHAPVLRVAAGAHRRREGGGHDGPCARRAPQAVHHARALPRAGSDAVEAPRRG